VAHGLPFPSNAPRDVLRASFDQAACALDEERRNYTEALDRAVLHVRGAETDRSAFGDR